MNLSEHVSKELLAQYGVKIPAGRLALSGEEAEARCRELNAQKYVVKAQINAGGRGLAGGIKFAATPSSVRQETEALLGSKLVTEQTGPAGEIVASVYVEEAVTIAHSFYIAIVVDTGSGQPMLLGSAKGGVEFEQMARMDASVVNVLPLPFSADQAPEGLETFLQGLGFPGEAAQGAAEQVLAALKAYRGNDINMVEINPFALTESGECIAVDAKIIIDDNALFRHPEFASLRDRESRSAEERIAQENEINLVKLDGDIGVVVNGAGLGLASNDMLVDAGGKPANFMDIRTTATSFHIARGVELLLGDPSVKLILLNVHGGGMTVCDTVAEGVAFAYSRSERKLPIVARMAGQGAEWALRILRERRLPHETFPDMSQAIRRAVEISRKGGV